MSSDFDMRRLDAVLLTQVLLNHVGIVWLGHVDLYDFYWSCHALVYQIWVYGGREEQRNDIKVNRATCRVNSYVQIRTAATALRFKLASRSNLPASRYQRP